jgi:methylmalonyl-CoA mutase
MATYRVIIAFSNPKIVLPKYKAWGDILRWCLQENVQENFLYCRFISFKREGEDPSRMFAVKVDQKEPTNAFIM